MRTGIKNKLALGLAALLLVAPVAMQARVGPGSLEDHVRNALAKVPSWAFLTISASAWMAEQ